MAVVIRMMRAGAKKRPFYRVVAADSRRQRDGRFLEILGHYDPLTQPYTFKIDQDAVRAWIAKGAQPSIQAASLLRTIGIVAAAPSKSPKDSKTSVAAGAKKKAVKRRKPREKTERRTLAKVARAKKKANPKKRQPKKK